MYVPIIHTFVSITESYLPLLSKLTGATSFRPGQESIIRSILAGDSSLAILPTSAGKSLCYQLPALLLPGTTLVISPLLALMKDQVDALRKRGVEAARLDSTLSAEETESVTKDLSTGRLKLLYISPEKFTSKEFSKLLRPVVIPLVAIDEAHCISEWGDNFRPDYLRIARTIRKLKIPCILALTATATKETRKDLQKAFRISAAATFSLSLQRDNLSLHVTPVTRLSRKEALKSFLIKHPGPAIVYVTRQEKAEEVATYLSKCGFNARSYHAGLRSNLRREIQDQFMDGEVNTVVATIAFGMGLDKKNIRSVVHYNLPKSLEGYSQEIGRAGRDSQASTCLTLAHADDLTSLENFIYSDTPTPQAVSNLLTHLFSSRGKIEFSLYGLAATTDVRQTVLEIILAKLEDSRHLELLKSFRAVRRIKLLRPRHLICAGRSAIERKRLAILIPDDHEDWKWINLDFSQMAEALKLKPSALTTWLVELEIAGDIALRYAGKINVIQIKKIPENLKFFTEDYSSFFQLREKKDLHRLTQVMDFFSDPGCLTSRLLDHFGQTLSGRCGTCCRCLGIKPTPLERTTPPDITDQEIAEIHALVRQHHSSLATPRQLARFLCGMSSPAAFRAKLYRLESYGLLTRHPFIDVLALTTGTLTPR